MSWRAMTELFFLSNIKIALKSHTTPLTNSKNLFFYAFPENYLSPIREQQAIRIFRIIVTWHEQKITHRIMERL